MRFNKYLCFLALFFSLLSLSTSLLASNPAAWEAYRQHQLDKALKLFRADLDKNPNDLDALYGWVMMNETVLGGPSYLDISEQLLKTDKLPLSYIDAFKNTLFPGVVAVKDRKRMAKIYNSFLERPDLTYDLKLAIETRRQTVVYISGEQESSLQELDKRLPGLRSWAFAGRFPNILGSGFNRVHGPENHPESSATFFDDQRNEVTWNELRNHRGDVTFINNYLPTDDAVVFLQTFITLQETATYRLNLAYLGNAKVWIDDVLVYEEEEERHVDLWHQDLVIDLTKGNHRLLLQLGTSELSGMNFTFNLLNDKGMPISNFTSSATALPYTSKPKLTFEIQKNKAFEEASLAAWKENASSPEMEVHLMQLLNNGYYKDARTLLNKINTIDPYTPSTIAFNQRLLSHEGNESGLAEFNGRHLEIHPNSIFAINNGIEEAMKEPDHDKVGLYVNQYVDLTGDAEQAMIYKVALKFINNDVNGGLLALDQARRKYPASSELKDFSLSISRSLYKDVARLIRIQKEYLDDYFTDDEYAYLARLYTEANNTKESIKIYQRLIELDPGDIDNRIALVKVLRESQQYKEAITEIDKALLQAPYVPHFHQTKGDILMLLDKEKEALESFNRALDLNTNNYELRARIRRITKAKNPMTLMDSIDIEQIMELNKELSLEEDYPIALLSDEVRRVVYDDGATEARYELLYKVLNDRGIEMLKEYGLGGVQILQAKIIREDGTRIDGESSGRQVVFPKLAIGDFVYLEYIAREYGSGKFRGHFWDEFRFNGWNPSLSIRYQMLVPNDFYFQHKTTGTDLQPTVVDHGNYSIYTWQMKDAPVMLDEYYGPVSADQAINLHISTIPDWNFIRDWYNDMSASRTKADYAVKEKVKELFPEGYQQVDEQERIRRIYEFISAKIEYSSLSFRQSSYVPQKASKTLSDQLGDCKDVSSLFVAMAREVEVDANLVLVDTRDNGKHHAALPSMEFNHCIVKLDKSDQYLELTDKYLPFGSMSNSLSNSVALPITFDEKSEITFLPDPVKLNGLNSTVSAKINGSDLTYVRATDYYGYGASMIRDGYVGQSSNDQKDRLRNYISGRIEKPFDLIDYSFEGLEGLGDTVVMNTSVKINGAVNKIQQLNVVQLPWISKNTNLDFLSADVRTSDLHLWRQTSYHLKTERIELELPASTSLTTLPENVSLDVEGLSYRLTFERSNNKLIATRSYQVKKDVFTPAEYAAVKEWFFKVSEADNQLIGI